VPAYFPASAKGGGAANLGGGGPRGGEGSLGVGSALATDLLAGGGAGGAFRPTTATVLEGLGDRFCGGGAVGGGGGGALVF